MALRDELANLDAMALAELVRTKQVRAIELVDASIAAIEKLNPTINAIVATTFEQARREALSPELPMGPFAGVPIVLKDAHAEVAGVPHNHGSQSLEGFVSEVDSEVVTLQKKAGLIILGKAAVPEFSIGTTTEPRRFGPTRNPWDLSRSPGGSSGGSAAAVACGMVPIAHAEDAGGSIRIPASACGLFGLKPTRGRISFAPHYGDILHGLLVHHGITRSVRDSAALLDATCVVVPGDPYREPPPARPFLASMSEAPRKLRIGFTTKTPIGEEVDPACAVAVREAAALCESLGHHVEEAAPSFQPEIFARVFGRVLAGYGAWSVLQWSRRTGRTPEEKNYEPFVWAFHQSSRELKVGDYLLALEELQRQCRLIARYFVDYDMWLTSTLREPPITLGTFRYNGEDAFETRVKMSRFAPYGSIANANGNPAMSVPLHWSPAGLPIGVQFMGRFADEATLFQLAAQLEAARPWIAKRPPPVT